jgi:BCD family chlorophyll transporter-like MFS transporter
MTPLGWLGIVRLGLVQTALGAIVVLTTSTLNRVMVVELALPAILPGALVAMHYAVQVLRPRLGYGSDLGGRRTPWIVGGMAVLCLGGLLAACATALMATHLPVGIGLAVIAFLLVGIGVGASGTALLVLLAKQVDPGRRAAAATIVWVMMIAGFVATAGLAGHFLDPFSPGRIVAVAAVVAVSAFALTLVAVSGVEGAQPAGDQPPASRSVGFAAAFREVWAEPEARRFSVFVFVSMLAYSAQDLILEPFAGLVFGLSVGQSTQLSGMQNAGVLAGMILLAVVATAFRGRPLGSLRSWTVAGCIGSAVALFALAFAGAVGPGWPLKTTVFLLGLANGAFAAAAIASMMALVSNGSEAREGVRMGLWGAAQAIAFGLGGLIGTAAVDLSGLVLDAPGAGYAVVLAGEGVLFLVAALLAGNIRREADAPHASTPMRYADETTRG